MPRSNTAQGIHLFFKFGFFLHQLAVFTFQVKVLPLAGRQMQVEDLAKTGDSDRKMLVGEYTAEIWNSSVMGAFTPS